MQQEHLAKIDRSYEPNEDRSKSKTERQAETENRPRNARCRRDELILTFPNPKAHYKFKNKSLLVYDPSLYDNVCVGQHIVLQMDTCLVVMSSTLHAWEEIIIHSLSMRCKTEDTRSICGGGGNAGKADRSTPEYTDPPSVEEARKKAEGAVGTSDRTRRREGPKADGPPMADGSRMVDGPSMADGPRMGDGPPMADGPRLLD